PFLLLREVRLRREIQQQDRFKKVQDVHTGLTSTTRLIDGALNILAVNRRDREAVDIGSVHRKCCRDFLNGPGRLSRWKRRCLLFGGQLSQRCLEPLKLCLKKTINNLSFLLVGYCLERISFIDKVTPVAPFQSRQSGGVNKYSVDLIEKLVSGGAFHRPVVRQLFFSQKYLFDHYIYFS